MVEGVAVPDNDGRNERALQRVHEDPDEWRDQSFFEAREGQESDNEKPRYRDRRTKVSILRIC